MTKQCKNCGKDIRNDLTFCSSACIHEYRNRKESKSDSEMNMESETPFTEHAKKNSPKKEPKKTEPKKERNFNIDNFKLELDLLDNSKSKLVELGLARGSSIKGKVIGFDDRYGKIVIETIENNIKKNIIVKFNYIVSFTVYE